MKTFVASLVLILGAAAPAFAGPDSPATITTPAIETKVEGLLAQLTLDEKIALLGGDETGFNSGGVPRLGIPPIRMSDGPVGVRDGESTAFPVSINMAAAWDVDLVRRFGEALGEETLAKGKNAILGPCVGIGRFPLGGRNFEAFGEDPFLSSRLAVNVIEGIQSRHVIATVKHYACNDQEWERNNYDVQVDERSLRETHLLPFEAAVQEAGVWMLMSAYNKVNGAHMSENAPLLDAILKREWGFQGLVVSDWVSVYSTADAANHGLDIEMPQAIWLGDKLRAAVDDGRVPVSVIDDKVRRHLRVRFLAGIFDNPAPQPDPAVIRSQAHRDLAQEMALKSMVLVKNDGMLPLDRSALKSVAVVGPSAAVARSGGGGSSQVKPWVSVSPLAGLEAALDKGTTVTTAAGVVLDSFSAVPLPATLLRTPDGQQQGLLGEYFPTPHFEGEPAFTRIDDGIDFGWGSAGPGNGLGKNDYSIRWTGTLTVPKTGDYDLAIGSDDGSWLYLDDELVADNGGNHGEIYVPAHVRLEAGRAYRVRLDYQQSGGDASMRLGWKDPRSNEEVPTVEQAVAVARDAEVAVLCVGLTANQESEGADIAGFELQRGQAQLVEQVLAANPNTIVVVYGGVPRLMKPWLEKARAVVVALYPGQEGGTALAQLLLGDRNFSGKLPFSYIQETSESPAFAPYRNPDLQVPYSEGVFVGYKYYDAHAIAPLFPFGFGLSYTTFDYSDLAAKKTGDASFDVAVSVANTGERAGEEIVELYVEPVNPPVARPVRELKGFARVALAPGEKKTVTIPLNARSFSYYDAANHAWVAAPGQYHIRVGASSRDLRQSATVTLE